MTREESIEKLKKPAYDEEAIRQDFEYIAKKLGITEDELRNYMNLPNKTYRDYKNQMTIYDFGTKISRFFGIERGGKR